MSRLKLSIMRKWIAMLALVSLVLLTGCESMKATYPRIEYRNSPYNFDMYNREIEVQDGYVLDEGHSYDTVETEDGYDVILHFVKK